VTDNVDGFASKIIAGRYRLDHPIGQGGMGEVWAGYDLRLDRRVAVKLLKQPAIGAAVFGAISDSIRVDLEAAAETARLRFLREVRTTAGLTSPGIPAVHDAGEDEATGGLYLVMQLLQGAEVGIIIDETDYVHDPLPVSWVAAIGAQIAAVLVEVHRLSVVHRDIKPRNLFITTGGIVKVLDFGVAALRDGGETTRLTRIGQTVGTPPYMAPEQVFNSAVGPAADIYGLGCVLHQMLTGAPPFRDSPSMSVTEHHVRTPPPPVRTVRPQVPEPIEALVLSMLAKQAEQRPDAEYVYVALLPYTMTLSQLAGRDELDPCLPFVRPMAAASSATKTIRTAHTASDNPISETEADAARELAATLIEADQFTQAIDALSAALARGGPERVLADLRLTLASAFLLAGDHRQALIEFESAGRSLARQYGPEDEDVLHCQYQMALCHAALGEPTAALELLQTFLAAWRRREGDDNHRSLEARQQIALLLAVVGNFQEARSELTALRNDFARLFGAQSGEVAGIDQQLARIERYGPQA